MVDEGAAPNDVIRASRRGSAGPPPEQGFAPATLSVASLEGWTQPSRGLLLQGVLVQRLRAFPASSP